MSVTDASEHVGQRRQEMASAASELAAPVLESARTEKSRLDLEVKEREASKALEDDDEEAWLKIRVVDDRGVPIQDAISYYEYIESPTDENGEAEIYLPLEAEMFWVTARGYEVLAIPPPALRDQILEITLLDSTMLHVKWLVPEHLDLGSLRVCFVSDDLVFLADEEGNPLKRVAVEYRYGDIEGFYNSGSVGSDGRATLHGILSKTIDLLIRPSGPYASVIFDDLMIPKEDEVLKVVIKEARTVSVYLQTPDGQFLSGAGKAQDGIAGVKRLNGPPTSLFMKAAPQHAFGFRWTVGGRSGDVTIPAGVAEHVIAVPAMGSVSLHAIRGDVEGNYLYIAIFEGDHEDSYPHGIFFGFPKGGAETQREIPSLQAG